MLPVLLGAYKTVKDIPHLRDTTVRMICEMLTTYRPDGKRNLFSSREACSDIHDQDW